MRRAELRAVVAITTLAALLRFATLDVQSFWFDEAVTVDLLGRGFGDMLAELPESESTPPLYYVLAWAWAQVFGLGEVGLRSFSALLGTVTVPAAWLAARELVSHRAALTVAALAAANPLLVWYSQEARSYALLLLLGTLSLWLCARLLNRPSRRDAALWALASALAIATHYFAVFAVAGMGAVLVARAPLRREVLPAIAATGVAGACLLPLAIAQESAGFASFIGNDSLLERTAQVGKQFLVGFSSPVEVASSVLALVLAAGGIAMALLRPDAADRGGIRIAGMIAISGLALPLLIALLGKDYVLTRNVILAWAPVAIVVAAGLTATAAGRPGLAALTLLGGLMLVTTAVVPLERSWQRENWRGAAEEIGPPTPRAIVVTDPESARPLRLYRPGSAPARRARVQEVILLAPRGRQRGDSVPEAPDPDLVAALGLRRAGGAREPSYELVRLVPKSGSVVLGTQQLKQVQLRSGQDGAAVLFEGADD